MIILSYSPALLIKLLYGGKGVEISLSFVSFVSDGAEVPCGPTAEFCLFTLFVTCESWVVSPVLATKG